VVTPGTACLSQVDPTEQEVTELRPLRGSLIMSCHYSTLGGPDPAPPSAGRHHVCRKSAGNSYHILARISVYRCIFVFRIL
jgi:hypothetical protein